MRRVVRDGIAQLSINPRPEASETRSGAVLDLCASRRPYVKSQAKPLRDCNEPYTSICLKYINTLYVGFGIKKKKTSDPKNLMNWCDRYKSTCSPRPARLYHNRYAMLCFIYCASPTRNGTDIYIIRPCVCVCNRYIR